jgi:TolB protein
MANPADAGLYTVRSSDAGDRVRITAEPPKGFDTGYGYSPDGSRVLFARAPVLGEARRQWGYPANFSGALGHRPRFLRSVGADWSPNESRVTFAGFQKRSGPALFVVNADGTGLRRITPPGLGAFSAQWSPNGEWIAFTGLRRVPELWIVHPDGTGKAERLCGELPKRRTPRSLGRGTRIHDQLRTYYGTVTPIRLAQKASSQASPLGDRRRPPLRSPR